MTEKQQKAVYAVSVLVFLIFCGLVGWYIGIPMVRFAEDPEAFRAWVDGTGIWGRVIFVCMVIIQVLVAFIPGEAIELAAGYAFGAVEGTLLSMVGIVTGSWIIFWLVRKFGVKIVETFFDKKKISEVGFLKNTKKTKVLAFLLMLIPGTPKDFLSYFAGLTNLELSHWLCIVLVARIPSVVTSTVTGAAAGEERYILAASMLVLTGIISAAGILYYRRLCKQENETNASNDQAA